MILQRQFEKAAEAGDLETVRRLVGLGCVFPKNRDSWALRSAAEKGHIQIVKFLIPKSSPRANRSGALRLAAANGHLAVVEILLPHSFLAALDYDAFRLSIERGHRDVSNFLQQHVPWYVLRKYV